MINGVNFKAKASYGVDELVGERGRNEEIGREQTKRRSFTL